MDAQTGVVQAHMPGVSGVLLRMDHQFALLQAEVRPVASVRVIGDVYVVLHHASSFVLGLVDAQGRAFTHGVEFMHGYEFMHEFEQVLGQVRVSNVTSRGTFQVTGEILGSVLMKVHLEGATPSESGLEREAHTLPATYVMLHVVESKQEPDQTSPIVERPSTPVVDQASRENTVLLKELREIQANMAQNGMLVVVSVCLGLLVLLAVYRMGARTVSTSLVLEEPLLMTPFKGDSESRTAKSPYALPPRRRANLNASSPFNSR